MIAAEALPLGDEAEQPLRIARRECRHGSHRIRRTTYGLQSPNGQSSRVETSRRRRPSYAGSNPGRPRRSGWSSSEKQTPARLPHGRSEVAERAGGGEYSSERTADGRRDDTHILSGLPRLVSHHVTVAGVDESASCRHDV